MRGTRNPSPAGADEQQPRISWPDVGVIGLALAFAVYLSDFQDMPIYSAAGTSIVTVGLIIWVVQLPKQVNQALQVLRDIRSHLGGLP